MTATNHAVTGALVAVLVEQPLVAVPIAFMSHFLMDGLPHFGLNIVGLHERNNNPLFRRILLLDSVLAGSLLLSLPLILATSYNPWIVFACMFACMSPDLVWGWRFWYEIKTGKEKPKSHFSKLHLWVQWKETPGGIIVEIIWFAVVCTLLIINV